MTHSSKSWHMLFALRPTPLLQKLFLYSTSESQSSCPSSIYHRSTLFQSQTSQVLASYQQLQVQTRQITFFGWRLLCHHRTQVVRHQHLSLLGLPIVQHSNQLDMSSSLCHRGSTISSRVTWFGQPQSSCSPDCSSNRLRCPVVCSCISPRRLVPSSTSPPPLSSSPPLLPCFL